MSLIETVSVQCPHCWESIEIVVDCSVSEQQYTEDCFVCCRPIVLSIKVDPGGVPELLAMREDD